MKMIRKTIALLLALVMSVGLLAPVGSYATEAGDQPQGKDIQVNVHKILMSKEALDKHPADKAYKPSEGIANIQDFFGDAGAKEIKGVYFIAFKEGEAGYTSFDEKTFTDWTAKETAKMAGLTGDNGIVALTLASPGKYKIYEVKSKSTYTGPDNKLLAEQKAVPVELDLPNHARTETGIADEIHVYPKNTEDGPTVDKFVVDNNTDKKEASFDKDEIHTWAIEATVPTGFKDYQVFTLTDTLDPALSYVKDQTVTVKVKEKDDLTLTKGIDYNLTEPTEAEGGTLTVAFTAAGIAKLADAGVEGSIVRVEFKTTINENAVMSTNIPNTVTLKYGHDPNNTKEKKPGEEPRVYTGGKKFIKIDSDQDNKALTGATFVIKNSKGEYLVEKEGKYSWKTVASEKAADLLDDADLKKIVSGADGKFEITGLKYDRPAGTEYKLKEVKAPTDYALLDNEITFKVDDKSYYSDVTALTEATPQEIDNKKITIPQTGGMGTIAFIIVGLALMGGALVAIRRRTA